MILQSTVKKMMGDIRRLLAWSGHERWDGTRIGWNDLFDLYTSQTDSERFHFMRSVGLMGCCMIQEVIILFLMVLFLMAFTYPLSRYVGDPSHWQGDFRDDRE